MKSKILNIFAALTLSAGFVACDNHNYGNDVTAQGKLSFADFGVEVETSETEIESRADVNVSDFLVKIINSDNVVVQQATYGSLPEVVTLPIGDYTVKVESHEVQKAEFEHPYYAGSTSVKVETNKVKDAGIVKCTFSSIRVSIRYAENLLPLLGDDVTVRVRANDSGELEFTRDETRSGYFEAVEGSSTMVAVFEGSVAGSSMWLRKELTDVEAGHHRIITFKVKGMPEMPEETGSINVDGITIDAEVIDEDTNGNVTVEEDNLGNEDRPGQEDPEDDKEPTPDEPDQPTPPVGDSDVTIDAPELIFDEAQSPTSVSSGVVNIFVESGLAHLYLEVNSTNDDFRENAIAPLFGTGRYDLANPPSEESAATVRELGIKCGDEILNEQEIKFDITTFLPMLPMFTGTHEFVLTVVSNNGSSETKSLIFIVE